MQIEMRKKENWIGNIVPKNEMGRERERETRLQVFVFHHFTLEQQEQQR